MSTDEGKQTFLEGVFRYRSTEACIETGVMFLCGILFGWPLSIMQGAWRLLPIAITCAFEVAAIFHLGKILRNDQDFYIVDEDGITINKNFWNWSQVRRVYAEGWAAKPWIELKFSTAWSGDTIRVRPGLSPDQYEQLISTLRRNIGRRFENLKLGGYQMPPSSG